MSFKAAVIALLACLVGAVAYFGIGQVRASRCATLEQRYINHYQALQTYAVARGSTGDAAAQANASQMADQERQRMVGTLADLQNDCGSDAVRTAQRKAHPILRP